MEKEEKTNVSKQKIFKFEHKRHHSSNEDMLKFDFLNSNALSTQLTSPAYGFGTSTRIQFEKVFNSKKICSTQFKGLSSPGPIYLADDKIIRKENPAWSLKGKRRYSCLTGMENKSEVNFIEIMHADKFCRTKSPQVIFGKENRFPLAQNKKPCNLGQGIALQFDRDFKFAKPPSYYFGARGLPKSRSLQVRREKNPSKYTDINPNWPALSNYVVSPAFSIPKTEQFKDEKGLSVNQTFEAYSSLGVQKRSQKRTAPRLSFDKGYRSYGKLNSHILEMTKGRFSLNILHAYY